MSNIAQTEVVHEKNSPVIGEQWRNFESQSETSFFSSWEWVSTWYGTIAEGKNAGFLKLIFDDQLVGLAVGSVAENRNRLLMRRKHLWLGETGSPALDRLTIEHNGVVHAKASRHQALLSIISYLMQGKPTGIDEIHFSGITPELLAACENACNAIHCKMKIKKRSPYFWVKLTGIGDRNVYLAQLSSNTRRQVKRALGKFKKAGEVSLSAAKSLKEMLGWFEELVDLHQEYWRSRGTAGAFDTELIREFHRSLIAASWENNYCEVLRVSVGSRTVGYLYNFVYRGVVSYYQGGIDYKNFGELKPGLISHVLAIEYYARQGQSLYDFLAGDSQYKRSLSTASDFMYWVSFTRRNMFRRP